MKKLLICVAIICVVLNFYGCNNQLINEGNDSQKSQDIENTSFEDSTSFQEVSETPNNIITNLTDFMLDPYGYADAEYIDFIKNNPVDKLIDLDADYQELSEEIKNGTRIWKEEIDYAITELFKDMQDENLQNKLLENQKTWDAFAKDEFAFDEELIYSNQLGGYEVDLGLSTKYMLLCRNRALHIKYLHFMLECGISDRDKTDYLSLKFKNA